MPRMVSGEEMLAETEKVIAQDGYAIEGVFHDERRDCYAYTVGCIDELVIVGLRPEQAAAILRVVIDRIKLSPAPPSHGDIREDVVAHNRVKFVACPTDAPAFPLTMARLHRANPEDSGRPFRAFQVLWPDEDGRLPGEQGYDAVTFPQRVLGGVA